jgi:protein N-terminal amidase
MGWNTTEDASYFHQFQEESCTNTRSYLLARLKPFLAIDRAREVMVIMTNLTGVEGDAVYAGRSTALGIESGEVELYGIWCRREVELLMIDLSEPRGSSSYLTRSENITDQ